MNKKKGLFIVLLCACLMTSCAPALEDVDVSAVMETVMEGAQIVQNEMEAETAGQSDEAENDKAAEQSGAIIVLTDVPDYAGDSYVAINGNVPDFTDDDLTTVSYESYSELDALGRCGVACACVGQDIMPTEERGDISSVRPTGWHTVQYDTVSGNYLYNRCHLLAYELTGENDNEKNLITGTRYFNVEGMLPFENMVADYVKETGNHVLYRVTPIFDGDDLVARGVLMEAMSVEDRGEDILFCVYCYNVQPGIGIDYATGDSWEDETYVESEEESAEAAGSGEARAQSGDVNTYILNTRSKKFHDPDCSSVEQISEGNKQEYTGSRADLIEQGYDPCKECNP